MVVVSVRRAKFVLPMPELHRALGLGPELRVVGVHVSRDPDAVHVVVEGDGVPEFPMHLAEQAAAGVAEAPALRWPQPAGPRSSSPAAVAESAPTVGELFPQAVRVAEEAESAAIRAVLRGATPDEAFAALRPAGLLERLQAAAQMRAENRARNQVLDVLEEHGVSGRAVDELTSMLSAAANRRAE